MVLNLIFLAFGCIGSLFVLVLLYLLCFRKRSTNIAVGPVVGNIAPAEKQQSCNCANRERSVTLEQLTAETIAWLKTKCPDDPALDASMRAFAFKIKAYSDIANTLEKCEKRFNI